MSAGCDIVLTTLNARYGHSSLALRYLLANLGSLAEAARICELTIHDRPIDAAEELLRHQPRIIGIGVYIWNAVESLELVRLLRAIRPEVTLVLGGPEVSHELEVQEIVRLADYTICGEGDLAFAELCEEVLAGRSPRAPILRPGLPELDQLSSPYPLYTDHDIEARSIYVEASRGCPFRCEFCLSSLDQKVRAFPLETFLADMERLIERGARHFKFIDRTFNLNVRTSTLILEFFLSRVDKGLFLHFEMVPDRFPEPLRDLVAAFPPGSVQFEIGIQTFDDATSERISRRQDLERLEDNLRFLRRHTGVHVHADLIVGLPGESLESFARGFDRLVALEPQEIQVGILKRLRGTPIARHSEAYEIVYSPSPPYEIVRSRDLDFETLQRLKRFARAWDLIANSGNFRDTLPLLWGDESPFWSFLALSDWLHGRAGHFTGINLTRLCRFVLDYLLERGLGEEQAAAALARDYSRAGRRLPDFLSAYPPAPPSPTRAGTPPRQSRHLGG